MHSIVDKQDYWSNIAWAAYLGCTELVPVLWCFKSDDSLLLRGMLKDTMVSLVCIQTVLLFATRCSCKCIDLAMCISGGFV